MSKYGKFTGGQIEAILNKVCNGDESILDGLLHDKLEFIVMSTDWGEASKPNDDTSVCAVFTPCRCTICGGHFADSGDTVCVNGHEIGCRYRNTMVKI